MEINNYLEQVGALVGQDKLPEAINLLHKLLKNTPKLDEVIIQSSRYNDISKQIRMGTVDFSQANLTKNQIRFAILELSTEIEDAVSTNPQIKGEVSGYARQWQAETANIQTHSGTGNIIGRDNISIGNQQNHGHSGVGDTVGGDKTTFISVPIRWTIVAGLSAALLGWYLIWGKPDTMPTANFEYYTEGAKDNVAIANKPIKFKDKSIDAYSVKWTFPDGETSTDKEVIQTCKYQGTYKVKLEAFSRRGNLVNEKIINCAVYASDNRDDMAQIKFVFEHVNSVNVVGTPKIEIGCIRSNWCEDKSKCEWLVVKGEQPYFISGNAIIKKRSGGYEHCEIHGSGKIVFKDRTIYRIFYTDRSSCEVTMEEVPNGYIVPTY